MAHTALLLCLLLLNLSYPQQTKPSYWQRVQTQNDLYANLTTEERATLLNQLLKAAPSSSSEGENEILYFMAFPNTFKEFKALFGYDDKAGPAILYQEAEEHLRYFYSIQSVPANAYLQKQIGIGREGEWEADAVNLFQHNLHTSVERNLDATVLILQDMPENQVKSFWYFYFAGSHPPKNIPAELNVIASVAPEVYLALKQAHQQALIQWPH